MDDEKSMGQDDEIRSLADEFDELAAEGKAVNEGRKEVLSRVEALGINRKAFKDACRLRNLDTDKLADYEESRRKIAQAFGWPDQLTLVLEAATGSTDDDDHVDTSDDPGTDEVPDDDEREQDEAA